MSLTDELAALGYAPDDITTLEDIDKHLMALGYQKQQILTDEMNQDPNDLLDSTEYLQKIQREKTNYEEVEAKRRNLRERHEFLSDKLKNTHASCETDVRYYTNALQLNKSEMRHCALNMAQVHCNINAFYPRYKPVGDIMYVRACRDALMSKRTLMVLEDISGNLSE